MARSLDRRAARFESAYAAAALREQSAAAHHRCELRLVVRMYSLLEKLRRPEDAGLARALAALDDARRELAAIPDTAELQAADAAQLPRAGPDEREKIARRFDGLIYSYRGDGHFDPEKASAAEWIAWCIARAEAAQSFAPASSAQDGDNNDGTD